MQTYLLKILAKWLGKIDNSGFEKVVNWVISVSEKQKSGIKKAEEVIGEFNKEWADRAGFAVRTVVQLAYAYARLKGLVIKNETK